MGKVLLKQNRIKPTHPATEQNDVVDINTMNEELRELNVWIKSPVTHVNYVDDVGECQSVSNRKLELSMRVHIALNINT